ncbi:Tetratricopeptide repeat family [Coleofasciculus chthonoplastes PCC 7420]|uniref:Tetratricopeptide repeat family n=1 Tax=Coleofasciculus chthonoplastes PCC 7420 TaxID=118168 RepID=B4VJ14_9CYAN|nr:tetratricopeptide repeat protein [Coleofasciculus chthonoplastes]EDX78103.1 Tetratricopeptide repeat family [Coleofasciculus chthonoplastes PCC 7420]
MTNQNTRLTTLLFAGLSLAGLSLSLPQIALTQSPPPSSLPHPDSLIANSTDDLAEANRLKQQVEQLYNQGKYNEAIPLAERMLRLYQSVYGEDHLDITYSLNYLGILYRNQGRYTEAEPLYRQALEMKKRLLGEEHPHVATSLNNLAYLYESQGRYTEAEPLYRQALEMYKRLLGEEHPLVATSLNNLAYLYESQGRYTEAEPLLRQALEMRKRLLGQDHPAVATSLNNLAGSYQSQGRYTEAEPLLRQALEMSKRLLGEEHPHVALSLNNLAALYDNQGRYSEAEPLYRQALEMRKRLLGQEHPDVATSLNNLAALYDNQGRYSEAEPLYRQALEMSKRLLGQEHPDVATSLNNLAGLYLYQGRYSEAEPLYRQALEMSKRLLGEEHPDVAQSLNNLALLYANLNDIDNTLTFLQQGLNVEEYNLAYNLASGFERQKRDYLQTLSGSTNFAPSFHLHHAPNNPKAANLALTTIFRRKGRILDVSTNSLQRLRQNLTPENQTLLDELSEAYSQLANLIYKTSDNDIISASEDYRTQLASVEQRVQQLENQLSRHSEQFRIESKPVTIETIQPLIPDDAVLVELVRYFPYNPSDDSYDAPRYAAYILSSTGEPEAIDLGAADTIEKRITDFRQLFQNGTQLPIPLIQQSARALDKVIMAPIREKLGNSRHILIAPDGALSLIPFEALVDESNRYLVETYSFTYLTSGRDLLRLQTPFPSHDNPVLIADPYFQRPGEFVADIRFIDLSQITFAPLPGTAEEAEAIGQLLNITPLMGNRATERAVKQVNSPSILHIATHGFFESNPQSEAGADTINNNPLLLSGLVLAGYSVGGDDGGEDGILTAQEVSALDLVGTKLVVLSACDTGLGNIDAGEGIYGLRRALVLAGAESQVMSLWKVSDTATKDLMVNYYQKLRENQGRSEALRQTQLEMIESGEYQHPYYWAAFIPSGDWTPMER